MSQTSVSHRGDMAFTPGPWEVIKPDNNSQPVVSSRDYEIATCWHHCVESIEKEARANAHLIAAAPDQNAALLALVARFNRFLASDRNQADAYNALVKGAFGDWQAACDALAKALGQSGGA